MKADVLFVSVPYLSTVRFNHPWIKQASSKRREILPKCDHWGCSQTGDDAVAKLWVPCAVHHCLESCFSRGAQPVTHCNSTTSQVGQCLEGGAHITYFSSPKRMSKVIISKLFRNKWKEAENPRETCMKSIVSGLWLRLNPKLETTMLRQTDPILN